MMPVFYLRRLLWRPAAKLFICVSCPFAFSGICTLALSCIMLLHLRRNVFNSCSFSSRYSIAAIPFVFNWWGKTTSVDRPQESDLLYYHTSKSFVIDVWKQRKMTAEFEVSCWWECRHPGADEQSALVQIPFPAPLTFFPTILQMFRVRCFVGRPYFLRLITALVRHAFKVNYGSARNVASSIRK